MPIIDGMEREREGILAVADLMLVAARTAPKSGGRDDIVTALATGPEAAALAAEIEKIAAERKEPAWLKPVALVRAAAAIVLIGVRGTKSYVCNCGACGYASCADFTAAEKRAGRDYDGPNCIFKTLDMGVALGSAVKTAGLLNADNRLYYRIGAAARRLRYLPEASILIGIPLSATGKNPNFDRETA
jgi:uncharacterized ferredoxin-like protein